MRAENLKTVDAAELMATPLQKPVFIVEGLLPLGLSILSGASKIGKSWLVLWLAAQVAKGEPVWGAPTCGTGVLYLSLEDTKVRLQKRLFELTDDIPEGKLHLAEASLRIGDGLEEQIEQYIKQYPDIKLVIVDTFQKVRDSASAAGKNGMYAGDYDDVSALKTVADSLGLAILLVHHLRKQKDAADPFNEMTGSTGLMGAADTTFLLKRSRGSELGQLLGTGRDIEYTELRLRWKAESHLWLLEERLTETDLRQRGIPSAVLSVAEFMKDKNYWRGTATQLLEAVGDTTTPANRITNLLVQHHFEVLEPLGISARPMRSNGSRYIELTRRDSRDNSDDSLGYSEEPSLPSLSVT